MEKELKFKLTREEYSKLRRRTKGKTLYQINVYFDDAKHSLRKQHIGLRIRLEDGKRAFLTVKAPAIAKAKAKRGWSQRQEWEVKVPYSRAERIARGKISLAEVTLAPLRQLLKIAPTTDLSAIRPLGHLSNYRSPLPIGGYHGELDRSWVFGERFYELEVEAADLEKADKVVRQALKNWGIALRPHDVSKLAVFFRLHRRHGSQKR